MLVEDEILITTLVVEILQDQGAIVIGPAATLVQALAMANGHALDAAILDVNLGSETSFPVGRLLRDREVPFLYTTTFAGKTHPDIAGEPFLPKPYGIRQLLSALEQILAPSHKVT